MGLAIWVGVLIVHTMLSLMYPKYRLPEFTSKEGKKIGTEFQKGLNILLDMIKVSAEKLKS